MLHSVNFALPPSPSDGNISEHIVIANCNTLALPNATINLSDKFRLDSFTLIGSSGIIKQFLIKNKLNWMTF